MELTGPSKRDFIDLRMRAELLDLCGDADGAERLRVLSLESAREVEINCYAYQLLWRGLFDEAIELLRLNVQRYPYSDNAQDSLAEALQMKARSDSGS